MNLKGAPSQFFAALKSNLSLQSVLSAFTHTQNAAENLRGRYPTSFSAQGEQILDTVSELEKIGSFYNFESIFILCIRSNRP